jgi:acylphosphatase
VFFRRFVQQHAQGLGLRGWVRNLSDGASVEVVVEGPPDQLETINLKRW